MLTKRVAGALSLVTVLIGVPSLALSQATAMAGMSGMDMGHPIVIPAGVLYTKADVEFMQGMIAHHSQAIVMSRMAESHGANPQVLKLSNKIDQSQVPEIHIMQAWLARNGQYAPRYVVVAHRDDVGHADARAQLQQLDAASRVGRLRPPTIST